MSNVIDFKTAASSLRKQKQLQQKKHILCLEGHHNWQLSDKKPFENKQGKLVSVYTCKRCNKQKTELH